MVVKTDVCAFSGFRIYPGHGIRYVPVVSAQSTRPVFPFVNKRSFVYFLAGKNPRDLSWTTQYRRNHKKGIVEEYKKSKKKKVKKAETKGIMGASIEFINAQKAQTEEQRQQILAAAKKAEAEKRKKLREKKDSAQKKKEDQSKTQKKTETKPQGGKQGKSTVPKTQKQHKSQK